MLPLPVDRKCLVYLHRLACLHTPTAKNALARIVTVKGIRHIDRIRLRLIRVLLVLNIQRESGIMNPAVLIVVVAYSAIQHMIAEYRVVGLGARSNCGV
jgi:hypothetical protein